MKFFSCFQRYERIILLRKKWLPERLRLFTAIHNNRPIAYGGPHVKFRGGASLTLATALLVVYQCWTWSGFRIAIQPDSAIQNRIRIGLDFENISTGSDIDIQTALITAIECLIRGFFGYKPDWIKYLDSATGLGLDWIKHRKYWTGFGSQKSSTRSTLVCTVDSVHIFLLHNSKTDETQIPKQLTNNYCIRSPPYRSVE